MAKKDKAEGETKPGGHKKLIIIGAAVAVLLAGGVGGGVFLLTKNDSATAATAEPTPTLTPGDVTALDAISVNLADGHYLKVGIALQGVLAASGGHEGSSTTIDGSKAYDAIIAEFSNLSMPDLENADQRNHYKDELQTKIIEAYTTEDHDTGEKTEEVMGIYLTQFVMQ